MSSSKSSKVSSSLFDLKSEIAKHQEEFIKNRAAGKSRLILGGVKRPDKKPTIWARPNKGVEARAARDIELEAVSKPTLESARAALERKAKIYEKLQKGQSGGLTERQYDALLVDFDLKTQDGAFESDSDDVDESLTVPTLEPNDDDDPIVEYEDEFGRMRTGRRSEIPRHLVTPSELEVPPDDDEDLVIRNPVNYFPVYEPTADRVAQIAEEYSEANNPLNMHYDSTREVRAKGAGFYAFSGDEETRKRQMEELKGARRETQAIRKETGAIDVKPGEVEGMQDETSLRSKVMEKRKRELDERRRLIEAKRRKLKGEAPQTEVRETESAAGVAPGPTGVGKVSEVPKVGKEEGKRRKSKGKEKADDAVSLADAFLVQLEQDMLGGKLK